MTKSRPTGGTNRPRRRGLLLPAIVSVSALVAGCSSSGSGAEADGPAEPGPGGVTSTTAASAAPQRLVDADATGDWTVFVYLAADNDLEAPGLDDVREMSQTTGTEFVVLMDRSPEYTDEALGELGDFEDTLLLRVGDGAVEVLDRPGELNMGDPATLQSFIGDNLPEYGSDHNALVLWDHGGAWKGVAWDDSSVIDGRKDNITLDELQAAVAGGLEAAGEEAFDLIGFDACLMATYEVAEALEPHTAYLLASEEVEPGAGWDWTAMSTPADGSTTVEFADQVIEAYAAFYEEAGDTATTLSLVDVTKLDGLDRAVTAVTAAMDGDARDAIGRIGYGRNEAVSFSRDPDPTRDYFMVDLGDLAVQLGEVEAMAGPAADLAAAVDAMVVSHRDGPVFARATGLAAYFPTQAQHHDPGYDGVPGGDQWRALLASYYGAAEAVEDGDLPLYVDEDRYLEDADVDYAADGLGVSAEVLSGTGGNIVSATLQWGRVDIDDPTWTLWFGERNAEVDGDTVSAAFDWRILEVTDGSTTAIAYADSHLDVDGAVDRVTIPVTYRRGNARAGGNLVLAVDGRTVTAETFYLNVDGGVSAVTPEAGDTFIPLLKRQNLVDFTVEWVPSLTEPVDATGGSDGLTYTFERLPAFGAVMVGLGIENIGGVEDWVYHGNATPEAD